MLRDMPARRLDQLDAPAARHRRSDPAAPGIRLHGVGRPRTVRRARREAPQAASSTSTSRACPRRSRTSRPEDLAANREMVRDLNRLLQERLAGGEPARTSTRSSPSTAQFFPGAQTLDDIIEQLAERMAAMQSLLRSMRPAAARRAAGDGGGAAARRPPALGPRPAGGVAGPADAGRPRRARPVQRRRAAGPRRRARADGEPPVAGRARGRSSTASSRRRLGRHRPRRGRATCSARTRRATSRPSTTSPGSSSGPATSSATASGSS